MRGDPLVVDRYMATAAPRKLQIGTGLHDLPGWLNTDIAPRPGQVYLDATRPLPFPDGSFGYVYAEQLIEHISHDSAIGLLKECRRILTPGGRVRLATTDLVQVLRLFDKTLTPVQQRVLEYSLQVNPPARTLTPECSILNLTFRAWGHQFIYDAPSLTATLELAGFQPAKRYALGESDDEHLKGVEMHWKDYVPGNGEQPKAEIAARQIDDYVSMYLEAPRP